MTTTSEISNWIHKSVESTREKIHKTDYDWEEISNITIFDYRSPLQLEAFWVNKPIEILIVVITHDESRDDLAITVNGGFNFSQLAEEVEEIIQNPRWQQIEKVPEYRHNMLGDHAARGQLLSTEFSRMYETADSLLTNNGNPSVRGSRVVDDVVCLCIYDVSKQSIKDGMQIREGLLEAGSEVSEQPSESEDTSGSGTYVYPPVWVNGAPEMSFSEKVTQKSENYAQTVFEDSFCGNKISIQKDGFIYIDVEDSDKAVDMFNCIFASGLFNNQVMDSVKGDGVTSIENPEAMYERYGIFSQLRKDLAPQSLFDSTKSPSNRNVISKNKIKSVINLAEKIYENEKQKEKASFLLQAYTHHRNNEFSQSYLFSWILIENHINHSLRSHLKSSKDMSNTRISDIIDSSNWGASNKIELAEVIGNITKETYSELSGFRKKRNNLVHKMSEVSEKDSADILNTAFDMLYNDEIISGGEPSQIPGI